MRHQFKPGDLAIITTDVRQVMPGSVVQIVRFKPARQLGERLDGRIIRSTEDAYLFTHPSIPEGYGAYAPVRFFVPLDADFVPDEKKVQEAKP
ncbi:hypothetical protein [Pseudomonas sp.]|uniref:hypothetical protein n=1 Tax=Pseudomonas sp. TaxID=306 RepID=UPI00289A6F35|nr:hypothetical protein [Pseudomonas sp.]